MQNHTVLSLTQPWALLLVLGEKRNETRSWMRSFRGRLLIHAASKWSEADRALLYVFIRRFKLDDSYNSPLWRLGHDPRMFGHIIGSVNVIDWKKQTHEDFLKLSGKEAALGLYAPGRSTIVCSEPRFFQTPVPIKGHLGLWTYEGEMPS